MIDKCYRCDEVISMCPCDESTYTADDEISRLRDELVGCKRDAERYRWLRRARMNVDVLVREDEDSVWIDMHGWDLDAYVDAALAAKESE